ncbi:MAG: Zn-dependent alcohol dehydrogenase [Chloroflexi bacterium]|nr:Zn-dependent alcohol dehydrogenase [Chloroflexota bacterium]
MKAAVLYEVNRPLAVEEIELDPPKAGEVRVRIAAAGICRSDLHFMKGEAKLKLPSVLGHEGSAIVEEAGPGVSSVKPGDHGILCFVPNCGRCRFCLTGRSNLCDAHARTGANLFDGTTRLHKGAQRISHMGKVACFAQQAVVPETGCIPIPADVPMPQAALIGCCVTTGVGAAMFSADLRPGSTAAVVGCGGVGLNIIQGAKLLGASKIIAVDINEARLEFARKFGATDFVNPKDQDPVARIRELTDGQGADYTFEAFGSAETAELAYTAARKGGTVVIAGIAPVGDRAAVDLVNLVRDEKTLKGTYYGSARPTVDMHTMLDLYLRGKLDLDDLVGRQYRLEDINEAFADLERGYPGRGLITAF